MSTTQIRMITAGLLFLALFGLGFWLSRSGKPYNTAVFTIHKLIALGTIVFLGTVINRVNQVTPLTTTQWAVIIFTALCFIATIVSGGLLSVDKTMPVVVQRLHQVAPYLTLLATVAIFYLLFAKTSQILPA